MDAFVAFLERCVFEPWICWGFMPLLAINIGFWATALPLEYIVRRAIQQQKENPDFKSFYGFQLIRYSGRRRDDALSAVHSQIPVRRQFLEALVQLIGKGALFGAVLARYTLPVILPAPKAALPLSFFQFLFQMVIMEIVDDFALYWGHRIQHTNKFLWEHYHKYHHQLLTPTAVSAAVIHEHDAALQATIPMLIAAVVARSHPVTFWCHIAFRVAQNAANHCGMSSILLDIVFLRFLPGRAKHSFHDSHHRFSNYPGDAKNYGEMFLIWDKLFGTYSRNPTMKEE